MLMSSLSIPLSLILCVQRILGHLHQTHGLIYVLLLNHISQT